MIAKPIAHRGGALRAALACALWTAAGCKSRPADLREWVPGDHSHEATGEDPGPGAAAPTDPLTNARALWSSQCASCHGREGRGDGPAATVARPPDMTTASFQSAHTDEQLATSILRGKSGTMPAFGTLRPEAVSVLARLVRSFGPR